MLNVIIRRHFCGLQSVARPKLHLGYTLKEICNGSSDTTALTQVLSEMANDPYQVKSCSGKEASITLNALSSIPIAHREGDPNYTSLVSIFCQRATVLLPHAMNKKSIAIAAFAVFKLSNETECATDFFAALCTFYSGSSCGTSIVSPRQVRYPTNLAHIAYALSHAKGVPIATKSEALNTWIKDCVIGETGQKMKVIDIVQILSAYAKAGVANTAALHALESASLRQLQYMDSQSVSAIVHAFTTLSYVPSLTTAEALLATANQCVADLNSRSLVCLLHGLAFWVTQQKLSVSRYGIEAILHQVPRLVRDVPVRSLPALLKAVVQLRAGVPRLNTRRWEEGLMVAVKDVGEKVKAEVGKGIVGKWVIPDIARGLAELQSSSVAKRAVEDFVDELLVSLVLEQSDSATEEMRGVIRNGVSVLEAYFPEKLASDSALAKVVARVKQNGDS